MSKKLTLIFLQTLLSLSVIFCLELEDSCEDDGAAPEGHRCNAYDSDDIACKNNGCEYNLVEKKCLPEMQDCPADYFTADPPGCIRYSPGPNNVTTLYVNAGVLCVNRINVNPNCKNASQAWGVNFGGEEFNYKWRYTIYAKDDASLRDDPDGIRSEKMVVDKNACSLAEIKDPFWQTMMGPVVIADKEKLKSGTQQCVTYFFKVCGDGTYGMSLWVFEGISAAVNQRCFDIKIGDQTVLRSIDPYRIASRQCARLEMIVTIKVKGSELFPKGFTTPIPFENKDKIPLRLCTGMCGAPDLTFQLSAASVHKYSGEGTC